VPTHRELRFDQPKQLYFQRPIHCGAMDFKDPGGLWHGGTFGDQASSESDLISS
jgi:hypothetical protein